MSERSAELGAFRHVPFMGVIFVVHEAVKRGFYNGHPEWSNLGQGQPEVGPMDGAPERLSQVTLEATDHAYGPLEGTEELRLRVADHYNRLYRRGMSSQYGPEHVCLAHGGRLALTRAMAALAPGTVGYQIPDYTAYEDMLALHLGRLDTHAVEALPEDGFTIPAERLAREAAGHGLSSFVVSNPCNPTGGLLDGSQLADWTSLARDTGLTLMMDEFYSHFIYTADGEPGDGPVSSAAFIDDVDTDPIVIFDGLTKSYRYPGWRVGWALGPPEMMESMARTASAMDGGPSRIVQRAALEVLEPERADQETRALRRVFAAKRNEMLSRLTRLGVRFAHQPRGTFYCWGSLADLPAPFDDAMEFFWRALDERVMTVPGQFFDVDPQKLRKDAPNYSQWMRFSFGPPMDNMRMGLSRLESMLGA